MDPSAWIALAGLSVVVLLQAAGMAFAMGGLFARLKSVENRPADQDCKAELAVLNTRFMQMEGLIKELGHDVKNLLTGKIAPGRRQRVED